MSRKIYISSDMGIDDRLAGIADTDPISALIWPWLLTLFDDWGRADASPRRIKGAIFGSIDAITTASITTALRKFIETGLLEAYTVDDRDFIAIPASKWFDYQSHIHTSKRTDDSKSKFPQPPSWGAWIATQNGTITEKCAINSDDSNTIAESRGKSRTDAGNRASPSTLPPYHPSVTPTVTVTPTTTTRSEARMPARASPPQSNTRRPVVGRRQWIEKTLLEHPEIREDYQFAISQPHVKDPEAYGHGFLLNRLEEDEIKRNTKTNTGAGKRSAATSSGGDGGKGGRKSAYPTAAEIVQQKREQERQTAALSAADGA